MLSPASLSLLSCLSLPPKGIVAIYGAGGKTSFMHVLAKDLALRGHKVIQTTTTKIRRPSLIPCIIGHDIQAVTEELRLHLQENHMVSLGLSLASDGKLAGIPSHWPDFLLKEGTADYILVEADGAARKSIKGYAHYEPVFPVNSCVLVPILGLDVIGSPVTEENVHRPDLFCRVTGCEPGTTLEISVLAAMYRHMIELGKSHSPQATIVPLFNKADAIADESIITGVAQALPPVGPYALFTSLADEHPVKFVYGLEEKNHGFGISAVLLAAGKGERMGKPKLNLDMGGKTIFERAVAAIEKAGIHDVVVVFSEQNLPDRRYLPSHFRSVVNTNIQEGLSSSVKQGLLNIQPQNQAVFFALADQPFITPDVYQELIQYHLRHLPIITAPVHNGKRGNPTLFDRRIWPELLKIKGDEGGRNIISAVSPHRLGLVRVKHEGVLVDIDTPEEYQRFLAGK
ncbi:MAG: putative selenium-dependent hydroxylase accessory protein YqeC [Syntrophobacterales bacterium]|jgi:molybdenum cofactor cytidylyltransferase|nr:putative selenium-dependent hydroxylase accessory protein YqeC [Syntrophobacterales bacterium]